MTECPEILPIFSINTVFSADGEPHITVTSLARVDYNGTVLWQPPSIYKSLCPVGYCTILPRAVVASEIVCKKSA